MLKTIRVAAIQHRARLGKPKENISKVTPFIEAAVNQGAELVGLPEMGISGYTLTKEIWNYSEPVGGPSEQWLQETAKEHQIHLCAGLIQHEDYDLYNTYLVASPEGKTIGRVRKTQTEYNIHQPGTLKSHIVDTEHGRIGIGICADTHRTFFPRYMKEQNLDLLLLPHAWPILNKLTRFATQKDINEQTQRAQNYATFYAEILGVPTVFINQTGPIAGEKWPFLTGRLMDIDYFKYAGFTTIATPKKVLAQLDDQEDFIIADIPLTKVQAKPIPDYDGWVHSGSAFFRKIILGVDVLLGKLSYRLSKRERKHKIAR